MEEDIVTIPLQEEDKTELSFYIEMLRKYAKKQEDLKKDFDCAQIMTGKLYETHQRIYKNGFNVDESIAFRNSSILTYFLKEAQKIDEETKMYADITLALREGLSLLLLERYKLDLSQQWEIDIDRGVLMYDPYKK